MTLVPYYLSEQQPPKAAPIVHSALKRAGIEKLSDCDPSTMTLAMYENSVCNEVFIQSN